MSSATVAMDGDIAITHSELGWSFVNWGLGLFVTGFVTGFIPILHYIPGAVAGDVGPAFLKNVTLWWGCPAVLAELTLKTGGLGMTAIGLCYLAAARQGAPTSISSHERIAPTLCAYGLIAELVTAGAGYAASATTSGRISISSQSRLERTCGSYCRGSASSCTWSASSTPSPASAGRRANSNDRLCSE